MNTTPRRISSLQNLSSYRQRSYSPPSSSFSRQSSDVSLYTQRLQSDPNTNNDGETTSSSSTRNGNMSTAEMTWTKKQWEALEAWYDKLERDVQQATAAFYEHENIISPTTGAPLWSKDFIRWRCQCLDTNTKYHHGVLPSERKRRKDLVKARKKLDLLKRQASTQQPQSKQGNDVDNHPPPPHSHHGHHNRGSTNSDKSKYSIKNMSSSSNSQSRR